MDKKELRKKLLAVRENISDKQGRSEKIKDLLMPVLLNFDTVGIYVSTENEVDTSGVIQSLLSLGKTVAIPKVCGRNMRFYKVDRAGLCALKTGKYGIKEPKENEDDFVPPNRIDAIVCPAVGFDKNMNRLGHGGGYYDRYLATCPALKVCVCFSDQAVDNLPSESFDIKADIIVTENGIIKP